MSINKDMIRVAMEEMGEGFSNLRICSAVRATNEIADANGERQGDRMIPQIGAKQPPVTRISLTMWVATVSTY